LRPDRRQRDDGMNGNCRLRVVVRVEQREAAMRKVTYGGAISLDGYLAGPNEAIDWLRYSEETSALIKESFKGVDTMLMGRKTYDFAQRMGGGPLHPGIRAYVFSRTLERIAERPDYELIREDVADFVRRIKREEGGGILVMGGGEIGSALIEAGLVDEIGFSIHPVLVGGGVPAFLPFSHRVELELVEGRAIAKGCVLVRYRVVN
jgi:dihydrofolate reductase